MATPGYQVDETLAVGGKSEDDKYTVVCTLSELQRLGKKRVSLGGRVLVLFFVEGRIYALDHFCYRM